MTTELIITNGDSAAGSMKIAGLGDEVLPWRDVLHEGPVPHIDSLSGLTELRAHYLASTGWTKLDQVTEDMRARDQMLWDNEKFDRISLWFEHDLYDQLQLLQILDFMAENPRADGELYLIQADDYLGAMKPEDLPPLDEKSVRVSEQQLILAKAAWWAFGQDTPEVWAELLNEDTNALPYLKPAIHRMLEELPGKDGLSRTQRQILKTIHEDDGKIGPLFGACQRCEDAMFMGDASFFDRLHGLAHTQKPALQGYGHLHYSHDMSDDERQAFFGRELRLTDFGRDILDGKADFADHNEIDFWWGGTLVTDHDLWRWDAKNCVLISGG